MGEWSEYFEDFPEQDPANYVGDEFAPAKAHALREQQADAARKLKDDQKQLDDEIAAIVQKHRKVD